MAEICGIWCKSSYLWSFHGLKKCIIFDLPSVKKLSRKYLNFYYLNILFATMNVNELKGTIKFGLVIMHF